MAKKSTGSIRAQRLTMDIVVHFILLLMCVIWLIPFVYLLAQSFRGGKDLGMFTTHFIPPFGDWTYTNYTRLFTDITSLNFPRMFMNTFVIACCSCFISTFFVLAVSYCLSRVKWKLRKSFMNMGMILGLFPGFMGMTATYFLLKAMGLTEGGMLPVAMIICYSAGAGAGFHVMKGYMDTIPKALDEAAYLDGATKWQTFIKVTLPLCKPMVVYQILTSFMGPWCDFVMAKLLVGGQAQYYTVSVGLYSMLEKEYVGNWFTRFCAGSVLIAIPISILYIITQRFYQEAMSGSVKG